MIWFAIGAGLAAAQLAFFNLATANERRPVALWGFAFAALTGAVVYGTIFWLLDSVVF